MQVKKFFQNHILLQVLGIILISSIGAGLYFRFGTKASFEIAGGEVPSFEAPLITSIELSRGQGSATFSRADGADRRATVTDFEGIIRPVKNGEARFEGARRVENLMSNSENVSVWTNMSGNNTLTLNSGIAPDGTMTADKVVANNGVQGTEYRNTTISSARKFIFSVYVKDAGVSYFHAQLGCSFSAWTNINLQTGALFGTLGGINAYSESVGNGWYRLFLVSPGTYTSCDPNIYISARDSSGNNINGDGVNGFYVWGAQVEDVSGQSNQNPSEYVSMGVKTSAPYHGANVDGVKYFATENGNTIASNVITEAIGTPIPDATLHGYVAEGVRTNLATNSEQFDLWSQTGTSVTVANTVTSPDGLMNADTLTDDNTGAYESVSGATVTVPNDSSTYTVSFYVKKTSGATARMGVNMGFSGGTTISTTPRFNSDTGVANGGTVQDVGNWWRWTISFANNSSGNTIFSYTIYPAPAGLVSGDAITNVGSVTIWGAQLEAGTFASSYIPTTSTAVTRAGDALSYPTNENIGENTFSLYLEMNRKNNANTSIPAKSPLSIGAYTGNSSINFGGYYGTNCSVIGQFSSTGLWDVQGTVGTSIVYGNTHKLAIKLKDDLQTFVGYKDGIQSANITSEYPKTAIWSGTPSLISIASLQNSTNSDQNITIRNIKIWKKALTDEQLQKLTGSNQEEARNSIKSAKIENLPDQGLVGYWNFDEGSGIIVNDASVHKNNGTLINGPVWTEGRIGGALNFDGSNDYVDIADSDALSLVGDMTISVWIKAVDFASYNSIIGKTYPASIPSPYDFYLLSSSGKPRFLRGNGTLYNNVAGNLAPSLNSWQHIVVTMSGTTVTHYLNGLNNGSGTLSTTLGDGGGSLRIGSRQGSDIYMKGVIDELRIYNRALSQQEITKLYEQSKIVSVTKMNTSQNTKYTEGLVGLWSFNGKDLSQTTAYDRSGYGHNGTLLNGPNPTIGKIGQALDFDGIDDTVQFDLSSLVVPYSVSLWFKTKNLYNHGGFLLGRGQGNYPIFLLASNNKLLNYNNSELYQYGTKVFNSNDFNTWTHAVFVVSSQTDASLWKMYINGLDNSGISSSESTTFNNFDSTTRIGSDWEGYYDAWNGVVDEVRIYNRALGAEEIQKIYNMGK